MYKKTYIRDSILPREVFGLLMKLFSVPLAA